MSSNTSNGKAIFRVVSGNFLEMFDFMVYGFYATAIAKTFFPADSAFASLMLSLATFGAGFLMRPLGAIFLGAYIDRHGRRKGLIITLALMAMGTILIACVPGYAVLGVAAPLLVLLGRLLQGFSAGVELGGVSVYLAEISTPGRKGFFVSWQSASQQAAVVFAGLLGVGLNHWLSPQEMGDWGWRVPFLVGCMIVPAIFMIRRSLEETPEFQARKHRPSLSEIVRSIGQNFGIVLAGMALVVMTTVSFYLITAYTPTFGKAELNLSDLDALLVTVCIGLSNFFLAACDGGVFRQDRTQTPAARCDDPGDPDRLSGAVLAGGEPQLQPFADRRAVVVVPVWIVQRCHGGGLDGNHAGRGAHHRFFPGLQSGDSDVRRVHPGGLYLSDSCAG